MCSPANHTFIKGKPFQPPLNPFGERARGGSYNLYAYLQHRIKMVYNRAPYNQGAFVVYLILAVAAFILSQFMGPVVAILLGTLLGLAMQNHAEAQRNKQFKMLLDRLEEIQNKLDNQ